MDKLFVDTDVFIDFLTNRKPHIEYSGKIFELADEGRIKIYTSVLSISNIHYICRKVLGGTKSLEVIQELLGLIEIQSMGKQEVISALESDFSNFEDALQHTSSKTIKGCLAIITRNVKDYRKADLPVFTPEIYVKMLQT